MKFQLIDTGFFYADGGAMFGAIPKTSWSRRYPSDEMNGCIMAMKMGVIRLPSGKVILIDNGAGTKQLKRLSYYRFFDLKDVHDELRKINIQPNDVSDVILTHLHFDHCGYSTIYQGGDLAPSFPEATYWVSREQYNSMYAPHPLEAGSYYLDNIQAIEKEGLLSIIETDTRICDNIELRIFNGHTRGQLVPYISNNEQQIVYAGDVIPLAASVSLEWISAYDIEPLISYEEKKRLLDEAADKKQILVFCHDAYTESATIKRINEFFALDQKELL